MNRDDICLEIVAAKVVAIIRTMGTDGLIEAVGALADGGVRAVEITLTNPDAVRGIEQVAKQFGDKVLLGAGTVLRVQEVDAVTQAGARYIVTPVCKPELIKASHARGVPILMGAFTPTEAWTAHEAGADFIKIFPAEQVNPGYIKALLAPLPQLRLVPTGGVTPENAAEWFRAGVAAVGVGSHLVSGELIAKKAWDEITARASRFLKAIGQ
jgi:2-dehydro-3-deoxyphosphogluconate aldolase/(4S)-4-hydroxy-2-oxoglutarate aldolase